MLIRESTFFFHNAPHTDQTSSPKKGLGNRLLRIPIVEVELLTITIQDDQDDQDVNATRQNVKLYRRSAQRCLCRSLCELCMTRLCRTYFEHQCGTSNSQCFVFIVALLNRGMGV